MADLHNSLVEQIGLRIVRGDWPPGSRVEVDALAAELHASNTAMREALRVIREKGMIDSWPKRGTIVRERSAWKLLDSDVIMWRREARRDDDRLLSELSELRDVIEPASARLAAMHRRPEDIEALTAAMVDFERAGRDVGRLEEADRRFHRRLLHATQNELMIRLDVVVVHALDARNRIQHSSTGSWKDPVPDHRAILDAVIAGDAEAAERAMRHAIRESDEDLSRGEPPFVETAEAS
jgi:GntR family transcriptional regulator, galactonate operon transcriptional repressor